MSFISNLFKRKPGGTVFGNLLRGVASAASGGVLGSGSMMISQQDADKRDLSDSDYEKKYGQTKSGVPIQPPATTTGDTVLTNSGVANAATKVKDFFKKPMVRLAIAAISIIGIIIIIIRYFKKRGGKRKGGY